MAIKFGMPSLGHTMEKGKIIEWLKQEGESVAKGEPLLVVETDKVVTEVEAPAATPVSDAVSALVNLGYAQAQAGTAVAAALKQTGDDAPAEHLIRHALKELAR